MASVERAVLKVAENLFRGPRPTSFSQLHGVATAVELEAGWYEALHPGARAVYEADAAAHGVKVLRFPMSDITAPNNATVRAALDAIDAALPTGVYVHCLHGQDRTGFVIAAYRISRMRWTYKDAVDEMLALGFHVIPYGPWISSLREFVHA